MTRARPPGEHYSSHGDLLQPARDGRLPLGAIVVPAARAAANLGTVLRLGADLGVPVVVLCSVDAAPDEVLRLADRAGASCTVVDLAEPVDPGFPALETSHFGEAIVGSHGDLSLKRNLGLALGRACRWSTLLFLDDDIRGVAPVLVRRAVGTLRAHAAAGMPATAYPDNSMVCHARRLGGAEQDVFVSGSALAVRLDGDRPGSFFPEVYNEDWLFLAPFLEDRQVARVGSVRQTRYDPFAEPLRAGGEEFGDVLAEGLVGALHAGPAEPATHADYWAGFLQRRAEFIAAAADGCRRSGHPAAARAVRALAVAEQARGRLSAAVLADYVCAWRADLRRWREYISGIAPRGDLPAALDALGLSATTTGPVPTRNTGS